MKKSRILHSCRSKDRKAERTLLTMGRASCEEEKGGRGGGGGEREEERSQECKNCTTADGLYRPPSSSLALLPLHPPPVSSLLRQGRGKKRVRVERDLNQWGTPQLWDVTDVTGGVRSIVTGCGEHYHRAVNGERALGGVGVCVW